jgi:hypothetical protein
MKSCIAVTKAAFSRKNFHLQIGLQFKEETTKVLYLDRTKKEKISCKK